VLADVTKEVADLHKAGKHTVLMRVKSNHAESASAKRRVKPQF